MSRLSARLGHAGSFMRVLVALLALFLGLATPADSTVNSSTSKTIVLGNNSQTVFSFSFIGVAASYITVLYTAADGTQTTLSQGAGTTQYQISLNAPVQGAIWGVGGTVTYNPSGTPIPSGSTLTIYRTLPLTQAINLQNLSSIAVLGKGAETGLDTGVMQGQQINETIGRAIVGNIANSAAPAPLPPAAQLANQGICGDSTGLNLIGCALPSSGVISSAMQPVVNAATLAAGRTAFGLGTMAVENINSGTCGGTTLQDDGSGNARVVFGQVADSTNQAVDCSYSQTQRTATGPITYTLPQASTLFAGWSFTVYVNSGLVTFTPNASDNFPGIASGGSVTVASGSICTLMSNGAGSGVWQLNCNNSPPNLSATVGANALTLTLNTARLTFRNPTIVSGNPLWAVVPSGISVTIPSGGTLGTSSGNVPFRLWIFAAYNGGTPILGVATCSTTTRIFSCRTYELQAATGFAISSGSNNSGVIYLPSGVTNDAVRIIGYAEYSSGLATAGAWASAPTKLQVCIQPFVCPMPGDVIQVNTATTTTATVHAAFSYVATANTVAIVPTSSINLIHVTANGTVTGNAVNNPSIFTQLRRGVGTAFGSDSQTTLGGSPATIVAPAIQEGYDAPATTSATNYTVYMNSLNAVSVTYGGGQIIKAEEIMG